MDSSSCDCRCSEIKCVCLIVGEQQLILFGMLLWFSVVLNALFRSSPWIFCSELNYLFCSMMRLKQGGKELKTLLSDICITMSAGHPIRQYVHIPKCTLNIFVFCSCCNAIIVIAYLVMLLLCHVSYCSQRTTIWQYCVGCAQKNNVLTK